MSTPTPRLGRNSFRAIADALAAEIASGEKAPGVFLGTERELQEQYGAGRSTIRKVLATLVDEGWAVNVPNKGVFAGRGLKPNQGNRIALVQNGTYVQRVLAERFAARLQEKGFELESVGGKADYPLEYALQQVLDGGYAGAIVWCFHPYPNAELVARLSRQVPVVALDHRMGRADTDVIGFDHEGAAYDVTTHLINQGCRRIGLTGMLDTLDITVHRIQGYMRAMFDHGLQPNASEFAFTWTSGQERAQDSLLESCLRGGSRPDGLLVLQDLFVPSAVAPALRAGLSLPHDLKIATIGDDIDIDIDGVGLTAAAFDWEMLVDRALTLLAQRLSDLHQPPKTITLPHRLIVRGSCGAPESLWTPNPHTLTGFQGAVPLPRPSYRFRSRWSVETRHTD